ncbi:MAG: hypothetical protein K6G52_04340 [Treponemataceae bacterium]|nr:hypothetical protein [Treponemataceae bacterium]
MQILRIVINSVSIFAIVMLCATYKLREKKIDRDLGNCIVQFVRKTNKLIIPVVIFALAMVVIQFFREFQLYICLILDAVAVLGTELALRDFIFQKKAGIYENAMIADGRIIKKNDIIALPTLEYEESEEYKKEKENDEFAADAYETAMKSLKIVSDSHGEFYVGFADAQERAKAVEILKGWI